MPERGPALVHDLGHALRQEVVGLLAHQAHDLALPALELAALEQEAQHVVGRRARARGGALARRRGALAVAHDRVERAPRALDRAAALVLAAAVLHVLAQRQERVDQVVQRQRAVEEDLDRVLAQAVDRLAHARGMVGHAVEHLALGGLEPDVVLEEVGVPADVRDHELLLHVGVRAHQVGVGRIVVDHQLVDLREPVLLALLEALVVHAEAPGGIAHREAAVGSQRVDVARVEHLEDDLEEVQAALARHALDAAHLLAQTRPAARPRAPSQRPLPRKTRIASAMPSRSLIAAVTRFSLPASAASRSFLNWPEP